MGVGARRGGRGEGGAGAWDFLEFRWFGGLLWQLGVGVFRAFLCGDCQTCV